MGSTHPQSTPANTGGRNLKVCKKLGLKARTSWCQPKTYNEKGMISYFEFLKPFLPLRIQWETVPGPSIKNGKKRSMLYPNFLTLDRNIKSPNWPMSPGHWKYLNNGSYRSRGRKDPDWPESSLKDDFCTPKCWQERKRSWGFKELCLFANLKMETA